ncbi:SseB family protein [Microbacterium sp.]|uniref:SseB family protein n=1 Tax=Microbacterium sp. TaxID=51671 RepID=UPI003A8FFA11
MALFSRGSKTTGTEGSQTPAEAADEAAVEAADEAMTPNAGEAVTPSEDETAVQDASAEASGITGDAATGDASDDGAVDVPQVSISTTSYGGFGANAPATPAAAPASAPVTGEAPAPSESIPGLPDNVVLRGALAALGEDPEGHEVLNVARQLLQGNAYLRVKGNAQELVDAGAELPLAIATRDDGQYVMVYSSGEALAAAVNADGDTATSAMGQAAPAILQYVLQGNFAGIMVDHASAPASVVLPRALIERMFAEMDPSLTLKRLVTGPRTPETTAQIAQALATVPLWIAVNRASEDDDWGVAESHTDAGERILPVFSHPLEVVALGRGDRPTPFAPAQLGAALRGDEGIDGVVVDPAGPWIRIDRADLGPVIDLPEPDAEQQIADEADEAADAAEPVDAGETATDDEAEDTEPVDGDGVPTVDDTDK